MQLQVNSIVCSSCANTVTNAIKKFVPDAEVTVNLETKIVTVETQATIDEVKKAIVSVGHTV